MRNPGRCQLINLPIIFKAFPGPFQAHFAERDIRDVPHSFYMSCKSNPSQNQSQDSEITGAFSFDRPVGKVLLLFNQLNVAVRLKR